MTDLLISDVCHLDRCDHDCGHQSVRIVFSDAGDEAFAAQVLSPDDARRCARDLERIADLAEAHNLKADGGLT